MVAPMTTTLRRALFGLGLGLGLGLTGCPKPVPKMVPPQEIEAPRMDPDALAQTDAAAEGKSGAVKVAYCVAPSGEVHGVEVVEPFSSDVDALAVQTVKTWRFAPATRDGEPYDFCTDVTFDLRF